MAAAATPLPKEDSTPPVMKMILVFTSPYIYLPSAVVKVASAADGKLTAPGRIFCREGASGFFTWLLTAKSDNSKRNLSVFTDGVAKKTAIFSK